MKLSLNKSKVIRGGINIVSLVTLLGIPATANAIEAIDLPPEWGSWGLAAFALIQFAQTIAGIFSGKERAASIEQENAELKARLAEREREVAEQRAEREKERKEELEALRAELLHLVDRRRPRPALRRRAQPIHDGAEP